MKAIVQDVYGPPEVLKLREVEKPAVGDNEALVRVRAASVNPYDWHFMRGEPYFMRLVSGLRSPKAKCRGADLAGVVEAVGKNLTGLHPGDEVFGQIGRGWGSFSEYVSVSGDWLAPKPANLTFEQAAAVPLAGMTALQGLRDFGKIQSGQKVLIIGAAGGVGTFAVQLAKHHDTEVTGVCSTPNVEMVRSLGADHVIDYTREDFTEGGPRFDLIYQLAGTETASHCRRALTAKGTLVLCSGSGGGTWFGPMGRLVRALATAPFVSQNVVTFVTDIKRSDLEILKDLLEAGTITPVIDRTYPLSEAPEALRYVETERARGKVVIAVQGA